MKKNKNRDTFFGFVSDEAEKLLICQSAYDEIMRTVGSRGPESGGILLGSREDFVVQKFVFDAHGSMGYASYDPNVQFINAVIKKEWNENGLALLGFIHSHPRGVERLSGDYGNNTGDVGYIKAILRVIPDLKKFLVPIMFSPADGKGPLKIFPYVAYRGQEDNYRSAQLTIIQDAEYLPKWINEKTAPAAETAKNAEDKKEFEFNTSRLENAVDVERMKNTNVVCVGVGGANGICESLVRTGLGSITLIDFDVVDPHNLVTQGYYISDIGKLKVEALKERLLLINPKVQVKSYSKSFLELTTEEEKEIFENTDVLMMMTDAFNAQAHGNLMGLKYQIPTIFAIMYERARGSEVTFTIPGVTPACHRCAVGSRYKAYLKDGFVNNVTSSGSTIFHTQYLNSVIGMLSLAMIHHGTADLEFSSWFGEKWERNLLQLRTSPLYQSNLFQRVFNGNEYVQFFDAVWQRITPDAPPDSEQCPDCGGYGDLRKKHPSASRNKD